MTKVISPERRRLLALPGLTRFQIANGDLPGFTEEEREISRAAILRDQPVSELTDVDSDADFDRGYEVGRDIGIKTVVGAVGNTNIDRYKIGYSKGMIDGLTSGLEAVGH